MHFRCNTGDEPQDYVETLGVNFMEKTIPTDDTEVSCWYAGLWLDCARRKRLQVTMSIWDLGGDRTYLSMLPMGA